MPAGRFGTSLPYELGRGRASSTTSASNASTRPANVLNVMLRSPLRLCVTYARDFPTRRANSAFVTPCAVISASITADAPRTTRSPAARGRLSLPMPVLLMSNLTAVNPTLPLP